MRFLTIFSQTLNANKSIDYTNAENVFNSIQWNKQNVNYLNRFYSIAPLTMHCNNSQGHRIEVNLKLIFNYLLFYIHCSCSYYTRFLI